MSLSNDPISHLSKVFMLSRSQRFSQSLRLHFFNLKSWITFFGKLKNAPNRDDIQNDTPKYALFRSILNEAWEDTVIVYPGSLNLQKVR